MSKCSRSGSTYDRHSWKQDGNYKSCSKCTSQRVKEGKSWRPATQEESGWADIISRLGK